MELYKRLRPKKFSELLGQSEVARAMSQMVTEDTVPHAILLSGQSGTGKTSAARILKDALGCTDDDFFEKNCADARGIDDIREIRSQMQISPWGKCKVYLIDESHSLTKDAQNAMLKMLEDTPPTVYFILATTEPQKLLPTIRTRCTHFAFKPLTDKVMRGLLKDAMVAEKNNGVNDDVIDCVIDAARGSARQALVLLEQVMMVKSEEAQLALITATEEKVAAVAICRELVKPKPDWSDIAKILKALEEEPEGIRRMVLGYFRTILLGGGKLAGRAAEVMTHFELNYFDSGAAGLALSCWRASH